MRPEGRGENDFIFENAHKTTKRECRGVRALNCTGRAGAQPRKNAKLATTWKEKVRPEGRGENDFRFDNSHKTTKRKCRGVRALSCTWRAGAQPRKNAKLATTLKEKVRPEGRGETPTGAL